MPSRLVWGAVMALSLLFSQTLGLLHGTVHNASQANVQAHWAAQADEPPEPGLRPASSVSLGIKLPNALQLLFSDHQTESDCLVYDQLSHCDAAPFIAVAALPLVIQAFLLSLLSGLAVARWHALFQARGPPLPR